MRFKIEIRLSYRKLKLYFLVFLRTRFENIGYVIDILVDLVIVILRFRVYLKWFKKFILRVVFVKKRYY